MDCADNGINDYTINDQMTAEGKNGSLMAQLIMKLNTPRKRYEEKLRELQKVELQTESTELGWMQ